MNSASKPSAAPTSSIRTLASAAAQAREPGEEAQVVPHGEDRVHARLLRREADQPLGRLGVAADIDAAHVHGAGVGAAEAGDDRDQRGLARPVGPEQTEDRPGVHLEVDAGERRRAAVRLPQRHDGEHRGAVTDRRVLSGC